MQRITMIDAAIRIEKLTLQYFVMAKMAVAASKMATIAVNNSSICLLGVECLHLLASEANICNVLL